MIHVRLFGDFAVEGDRAVGGPTLRDHVRPLASYLFSFPNELHRREKLLELFWSRADAERARAALRMALWRFRDHLEQSRSSCRVQADTKAIRLEIPDPDLIDAHRFRATVLAAISPQSGAFDLDAIERAVSLYKAPFLEEYSDSWVLAERERFQSLYFHALTVLMSAHAQTSRFGHAIKFGRRIVDCDPMRETAQRAVMILYVLNSQRGEAILQFERCKKALRDECDVAPAPETYSLLGLIRSGEIYEKLTTLLERELAFSRQVDVPLLSW